MIIGRIDPKTMTYTTIVNQPTNERLNAATVAIQVGDELWAGSFRGDRIARYPIPRREVRHRRTSRDKT